MCSRRHLIYISPHLPRSISLDCKGHPRVRYRRLHLLACMMCASPPVSRLNRSHRDAASKLRHPPCTLARRALAAPSPLCI